MNDTALELYGALDDLLSSILIEDEHGVIVGTRILQPKDPVLDRCRIALRAAKREHAYNYSSPSLKAWAANGGEDKLD